MEIKHKKFIVSILIIALAVAVPLSVYVSASYFLVSNHIQGTSNSLATLRISAFMFFSPLPC